MATSVAYSNLRSWLSSQAPNTKDTPYAVTITGLTEACQSGDKVDSIQQAVFYYDNIYLDLSTTTLTASNVTNCFYQCTNLVKAPAISSSVKNMDSTFSGCKNLIQAPTIPSSVTILTYTFYNCESLTTPPTISASITSMASTFSGCKNLTIAPTIPSSVTRLRHTFYHCEKLTTAPTIPNGVTDMFMTFEGCSSLQSAPTIPSSVTDMLQTFKDCSSLQSLPDGDFQNVTSFSNTFYRCTSLTSISSNCALFTTNRTTSHEFTFQDCTGLTEIYIFNSSTDNYYKNTFKGCSGITKVKFKTVPTGTQTTALKGCSVKKFYSDQPYKAKQFITNSGVTSAESTWEFRLLSSPASIAFSSLATELAILVSGETHNIKVTGLTASNIGSASTSGTLGNVIRASGKTVNISSTSLPSKADYSSVFNQCDKITAFPALPSNVTNLTDTFAGTNASSYPAIPSTVTNMTRTFEACHLMTSAPALPSNVTTLDSTFKSCNKITSAPTIPSKVTTMYRAFMSCTALTSAPTIPASVTTLESAFEGCSKLATLPAIGSGVTSIKAAFKGTKCTAIPTIPAKVTNAESAFENCTSLVSVAKVPSTITNGKSMFKGCTALTTINQFLISKDNLVNTSNYKDMFSGDTALANVKVPDTPQYAQADKWRLILLDIAASAVSGRIYNPDKTTVNIASTSITKSGKSLVLPILTDDLLFSQETFNNLAAICVNIIAHKYGYYNKTVLNPNGNQFVLYAKDQSAITTNIIDDNTARNTTVYSSNKVNSQIDSKAASIAATKVSDNNTAKGLVATKTDNAIARWDGTAGKLQNSGVTIDDNNNVALKSVKTTNITIQTGNSKQQRITLATLMTWLITTKKYITSGVNCHVVIQTSWAYADNDVLQLTANGRNFELQLAGVVIEFMGSATDYQTGMFRLRIHSSPTISISATSGYEIFPVSSIAEYTCNGKSYSPVWKIVGLAEKYANSYWGLTDPKNQDNVWVRTTSEGILPYQSGGATAGHSKIGTSSWYFLSSYIQKMYANVLQDLGFQTSAATSGTNKWVGVEAWSWGTSSGYIKLTNGLIIQWFQAIATGNWDTKNLLVSLSAITGYTAEIRTPADTGYPGATSDVTFRAFNKNNSNQIVSVDVGIQGGNQWRYCVIILGY